MDSHALVPRLDALALCLPDYDTLYLANLISLRGSLVGSSRSLNKSDVLLSNLYRPLVRGCGTLLNG